VPPLLLAVAAGVVIVLSAVIAATQRGGMLYIIPPVVGGMVAAGAWWICQGQLWAIRWLSAIAIVGLLASIVVQMSAAILSLTLILLGVAVAILVLRSCRSRMTTQTTVAGLVVIAIALVPFRGLVDVSLGGLAVGVSDMALGAALLVWIIGRRRGDDIAIPRFALVIGLFSAWLGLTVVNALDPVSVVKEVVKWLQVAVAIVVLAEVLRDESTRRVVVLAVGLAVAVEAIVGLGQAITGLGPGSFQVGGVIRSFGTFDQPNPFGGYLGLHVPLVLAGVIYARPTRRPWIVLLGIVLVAAIVISRSRGAWIGMGGSTAVVLLAVMPRMRPVGAVVAVLMVVVFVAIAAWQISVGITSVLPDPARAAVEGRIELRDALRIVVEDDYPVSERLAQWEVGWRMFMHHPLVGVGAGNYDASYPRFDFAPFYTPPGHAHNIYINFAAEAGLPGVAGFLLLTLWSLWRAVRAVQWSRGSDWEWATVGVLGGSVALALHNLFDSLFVSGMGMVFALFIALSYAIEWDRGRRRLDHGPVHRA